MLRSLLLLLTLLVVQFSLKAQNGQTSNTVNTPDCTDTLRYAQVKEQVLGTNKFFTMPIWQADNEGLSQTFLMGPGASVTVKGIEILGNNYRSGGEGKASIELNAALYQVNSNYVPTSKLAEGNVTINSTNADYHYVSFPSPVVVNHNYALVITVTTAGGIFHAYVTDVAPDQSYDENLCRYKSSYYPKSNGNWVSIPALTTGDAANWGSTLQFEPLLAPIVSYNLDAPAVDATPEAVCVNSPIFFSATAGPNELLGNRMINYQAFRKYFGQSVKDSTTLWVMEGETVAGTGLSINHTYTTPGTPTATFYVNTGFWAGCLKSGTKTVTINPPVPPTITTQPEAKEVLNGQQTSFTVASSNATGYRWQVASGSGFTDLGDNATYSGTGTATLTIVGAPELEGNKYRCMVSGGSCNGQQASETAKLTITLKLPQTISFAATATATYGDADFVPVASSDAGLPIQFSSNNENIAAFVNGKLQIRKAGLVQLTATQPGNEEYQAATAKVQELTIQPKSLTLTLSASPAIEKTYDGNTGISLAAGNYQLNGIVGDDEVKVAGTASFASASAGNDKTITVEQLKLSGVNNKNYSLTTVSEETTGTIHPKGLTVSLKASPAISKEFNGNAKASLLAGNTSILGIVDNDEVGISGTASYDNANAGADKTVSFSGISLTGSAKDNYYYAGDAELTTTGAISARPLTVTPDAQTKVYGENDPTLSYQVSGLLGNDQLSGSLTRESGTSVGKYAILQGSLSGGANYRIDQFSAAYLTIQSKSLTLTLSTSPVIEKTYDGNAGISLAAGNYQLNGIVGEDDVKASGVASFANEAAGNNKTITVAQLKLSGANHKNYKLTTVSEQTTGTINQKGLTVSLKASPAISKEFNGNASASLLAGNTSVLGIVDNDEVSISGTASYDNANAGTEKTVSFSGISLTGSAKDNYYYAGQATLTTTGVITTRPVTVIANDQLKVYGQNDPALSYQVTGLLGNDALPGALTREAGSAAGQYAIQQGSLAGGTNYRIDHFTSATLTINKANLLIRAEDQTKKQGTVNPVFTLAYEGLANGDRPESLTTPAVAQCAAVSGSPIGYYIINVAGASSPNYIITHENGKLSILPAGDSKVKAWSNGRGVLEVRIYAEKAQRSEIQLYTNSGNRVRVQAKQLVAGVNSVQLSIGNLTKGIYVLHLGAEQWKESVRILIP
ncbi:MAG: YDG domain-containing protein [Candidatus Pseudobacter hemicellulosilyticus]|uniref:YDG domain-containing protein n=1 Tax=Candidatus Pseudobacter hemicellulosilyticus TaxID=3121375 RepID=A0AAJ5WN63_9BACT|nr:MAG: YDG domain-containing protein [Pseudobacter sp.]